MHIVFRQIAQQMGMQNVRSILSEDIDTCINLAINEKVRSVLLQSVSPSAYADKLIRQNTTIAPINAIRTLYQKINITDIRTDAEDNRATENNPWYVVLNAGVFFIVMYYTGFKVKYNDDKLYDCRIIENEDLGSTLRDYCNRPTYDYPIVAIYNEDDNLKVNIFTGDQKDTDTNVMKPTVVQCTYIKNPAVVKLDNHNPNNNVDCDLPYYIHPEIVEIAANKYLTSVGATSPRQ